MKDRINCMVRLGKIRWRIVRIYMKYRDLEKTMDGIKEMEEREKRNYNRAENFNA